MSESKAQSIIDAIRGKFAEAIVAESTLREEAVITVEPANWSSMAKWLATEGGFTFLSDLCGVDRVAGEGRFEVVYNLTDMAELRRLRVRVPVAPDDPKLLSVTSIWPTANWLEREAFDMFGIVFDGHPDLERILMPDQWEGHPLRKDYSMGKVPVEYKHLSPGH
jgi:NADH-quinone oxidoreductase subunit C